MLCYTYDCRVGDTEANLADILQSHAEHELSGGNNGVTLVCVRRNHLWADSVVQFLKPSFDPRKPIPVVFHGEEAVDGGGPRREYFRGAIKDQSGLFFSKEGVVTFNANVAHFLERRYYLVGVMIATSILHGGLGFPFFPKVIYEYMVQQRMVGDVSLEDVANPEMLRIITKVK